MSLLGKFSKYAVVVAGKGLELGIKGIGRIGEAVSEHNNNYELADKFRNISDNIGEMTYSVAKTGGSLLEKGVDKAIEGGSKVGIYVGEKIAEHNGLDVEKSRKVGAAIGAGAVGLLGGEVVGSALSAVTAATGVASTGTAISTLHGAAATNATLAHIGGGALAAGGGGMAAGSTVLHTINVVSTVSSSVYGKNINDNDNVIEISDADYEVKNDV